MYLSSVNSVLGLRIIHQQDSIFTCPAAEYLTLKKAIFSLKSSLLSLVKYNVHVRTHMNTCK